MRIAVLSDIHANHLALQAVLTDARQNGVEKYWLLGDLIGYGPNPVAAVQWLMGEFEDFPAPDAWVMGNHDAMLADLLLQGKTGVAENVLRDPFNFSLPSDLTIPDDLKTLEAGSQPTDFVIQEKNREGKETGRELYRGKSRGKFLTPLDWKDLGGVAPLIALELNRCALTKNSTVDTFWRDAFTPDRVLPNEIHLDGMDYVLVHSGQVNHLFRYIYAWQHEFLIPKEFECLQEQASQREFPRVQFFGHTHVPTLVKAQIDQQGDGFNFNEEYIFPDETYTLTLGTETPWLALVNPGSVGQSRDLDRRAAYAILDTNERTVTFHRVQYDYQEIFRLLSLNHYPSSLGGRLLSARPTRGTPQDWRRHYEKARET